MKRTEERELAFKLIYSQFFDLDSDIKQDSNDIDNHDFTKKIFETYLNNKIEIESVISTHLKGYTLSRVNKIDLAIISLAVTELNFIKENPTKVVINEAVELAKKYSTEKSPKFVNGLLADIIK